MLLSFNVGDYAYVSQTARRGSIKIVLSELKRYRIRRVLERGRCNIIMYAIIQTGGKQYRVSEGDVVFVEKIEALDGEAVEFDRVLTVVTEGNVVIGQPLVAGAKVTGKVLSQGKDKKIFVFKYKAKSNYRRRQGHRQPFTKVVIEKIEA
jgi:large subunit ribosomal protein L21